MSRFKDDYHLLMSDQLSFNELTRMRENVKMISLQKDYTKCAQLGDINRDQVMVLTSVYHDRQSLYNQRKRERFYRFLDRCAVVKSIDFGHCDLPEDVLLEAFSRCPELDCIKFGKSFAGEEEWSQIMAQFGHKIVHIVKRTNDPSDASFWKSVASNCVNLQQIDCHIGILTRKLFLNLEDVLQNNCRVTIIAKFKVCAFKDVIDELITDEIDWVKLSKSKLETQVNRLASLKFSQLVYSFNGPIREIIFNGLKKLDISRSEEYSSQFVTCLVASQFPVLEEFIFNASARLTEDDYFNIFKRMPTVKNLAICLSDPNPKQGVMPKLPKRSIKKLKNIESIELKVLSYSEKWKLVQRLEKYVDKVHSLKKLTVDLMSCQSSEWVKTVAERVEGLKQERVEVDCYFKK